MQYAGLELVVTNRQILHPDVNNLCLEKEKTFQYAQIKSVVKHFPK